MLLPHPPLALRHTKISPRSFLASRYNSHESFFSALSRKKPHDSGIFVALFAGVALTLACSLLLFRHSPPPMCSGGAIPGGRPLRTCSEPHRYNKTRRRQAAANASPRENFGRSTVRNAVCKAFRPSGEEREQRSCSLRDLPLLVAGAHRAPPPQNGFLRRWRPMDFGVGIGHQDRLKQLCACSHSNTKKAWAKHFQIQIQQTVSVQELAAGDRSRSAWQRPGRAGARRLHARHQHGRFQIRKEICRNCGGL